MVYIFKTALYNLKEQKQGLYDITNIRKGENYEI